MNSRRRFLQASSLLTTGYWVAGGSSPPSSRSALEEIRFACIGVGGKGASDSTDAAKHGRIVAVCDIDDQTIAKCLSKPEFEKATVFHDYRKLFDEVGKGIDAVTVSTPDHTHAVATARALRMGIACYTQKPLTRPIYEARRLAELAEENKAVTQMGNQGSERSGLREAAAKIKAGCIGDVQEIHVWTDRPKWPQGSPRPAGEPIPPHIHWEEFIGPAEMREFSTSYAPFKWRGFWAFGTGALGDMACHTFNMPFAGCDLTNPIAVQAITSGHNRETFPGHSKITFEFAQTASRPACKMFWYDGGNRVDPELVEGRKISPSGCLVIGSRGKLFSPNDYGAEYVLLGGEDKDVDFVPSLGHFREFADAIRVGNPEGTWSNFHRYAGKLTEVILLGNLAVWAAGEAKAVGELVQSPRLEWDQANLQVKGNHAFDEMIKPVYRAGYEL